MNELHGRANVFHHFTVGLLFSFGIFVELYGGLADLGKVPENFIDVGRQLFSATALTGPESIQESLTPLRNSICPLCERDVVIGKERLELHLIAAQRT